LPGKRLELVWPEKIYKKFFPSFPPDLLWVVFAEEDLLQLLPDDFEFAGENHRYLSIHPDGQLLTPVGEFFKLPL